MVDEVQGLEVQELEEVLAVHNEVGVEGVEERSSLGAVLK